MRILALTVISVLIGQVAFALEPLDEPLAHYKEDRGGQGIVYFCTKLIRMPCGEEALPSDAQEERAPHYLDMKDTTPRKVLDELVRMLPSAKWTVRSGVINIEPIERGRNDVLGAILSTVSVQGVSSLKAALDVFDDAGIDISYEEMGRRRFFGTIDLELRNASVRDALNAIVKADGSLMWEFVHSKNPMAKGKGTLLLFSTRTTGKTTSEEWRKAKRWKHAHLENGTAPPAN